MKNKKKFARLSKILLTSALTLVCLPMANLQAEAGSMELSSSKTVKDALKIYFDEPVSQGTLIPGREGAFGTTEEDNRWQQLSLPIGNSYMGANVYGEVSKEHLTFNHKTLWNGGPSDSRPNYNGGNIDTVGNQSMADYVKSVQEAFLSGQDAKAMCGKIIGAKDGYGSYQSFGDIYLDFKLSGNVENYRRELDLNTSLANVDFSLNGTDYHREYLASYPDDVIAMKVSAKGNDKMNFDVSFPIDNATSSSLQKTVTTTVSDDKITVAGKMNDNQLKLNGQLKVYPVDGSVEAKGSSLTVKDASEVHIFVSASTDYKNEYPNYRTNETDEQLNTRVAKSIDDAYSAGYESVKENALNDYQEIFDRVELNLGQDVPDMPTDTLLEAYKNGSSSETDRRALETVLFQYGRYLQIASSRDGDLPANLQGVWNNRVGDENRIPWGSDYHMNVNLQMNYWPTYVTNMQECATPLIDYVDSLREPGRVTAKTYFGVVSDENNPENGFTAHTQNTPFGWTCPGWAFSWGWSPAAVPWILQNCYEYYEYTGDTTYLKEKIYPMLKEEAKLYQQILKEDPETGRMVTVPAYSPEHGPYTAGNTYEQSLVWQLFKDACEAAEALGVDADLSAQWKELQNKLDPIEIGDDGQIKEWYSETTLGSVSGSERKHRHMSHLLGLFPGDLISFDNEEYLNAAIVSLTDRGDDATGWGMGQRLNSWARVGDGNHAYDIIKAFFNRGAYPNLWDAHAPFQIDGNFGYTAGVAEMLMQSNMGYINMLPALPDVWATGHVSGLLARGNFEITMDWQNSNLTNAVILSKGGQDCTIQYPNISKASVLDENGDEVLFTKDANNKITFATEKNKTYTIEDIPEKPIKAPENAEVYSNGKSTFVVFDTIAGISSYNVYRSDEDGTYKKVATIDTNSYTDIYIAGAKYKVAAVTKNGEGEMTAALTPLDIGNIEKMDDRDSLITYTGSWGDWSDGGQYLGTEKYTYTNGDTMKFYFSGTGLKIIGMKANDTHTYDLYIDDQIVASNVDTNSSSTKRQQVLSEITGLKDGIHKVELVVKQAKISLDAFEIIRDVEVTGLDITSVSDTINLNETNTMQMQAKYLPAGASGEGVTWSVKNNLGLPSNIASIDNEGLLTVNHIGSVVVCATDKTDSTLTAEKTINVVKDVTSVKYDDRDSSITYGNNWSPWNDSKHENGTVTESTTKDSSFTFEFEGTGLALYFMKLEASGNYAGANIEVQIDGVSKGLFSTFTTVTGSEPKSKVFEDLSLGNGKHSAKVIVKDCPNDAPLGSNSKVSFDYYQVTKGSKDDPFDYTVLADEMKKFTDTDLTKYFIETVNAYQEVFDQAKNKYEVADSQTEINELVELLKTRYEALVNKAEYKVQLNNLILAWDGKDLSEYKESGVINLNKALDSAKIVYDNDDASKQEVDQVIEALNDAINALEKIGVEVQANKLALQITVEVADKVTDKDLENVVPAVVNEFKAALANAKAVLDDANATQEQADTAFDCLANAMHMLEFFKGNKTDLDKLVTQIEGLNQADYSEVSWNAMLPVLDEAKDVLANENAMQEEVNETYTKLVKAFLELRLKPNKDLLQELINKANGLNAANYTAKSWQALQKEVEKASEVLADSKADYATVERAIESLKGSIEALEEKTPEVLDGKENAIKTGDSSNMSQLGVVMLLAGAAVVTLRRKKIEE
ncbi:glycoside hydrolase N-terminal domain-containing protein [Thomasclavelia cocleata]|uniref:glycosyl hydrolase family 95 catalytic domain-containing protein n=2 Tax=Thomasclavelia cocleata TaxID=69824 RepID=UPI003517018C